MVVMYFATFVLSNSTYAFGTAIVATIEIDIYSRSTIHDECGKEKGKKYVKAFSHWGTKIWQMVEKHTK